MVKSWKEKEKQLTEWLNKVVDFWKAFRRSRALRGEAVEDVMWGPISVELKTRKNWPPKYVLDWLEQARTNAEKRTPIVVVHGDYMRMGDQLVIMTLQGLVDVVNKAKRSL